jgi:hypothetical protein
MVAGCWVNESVELAWSDLNVIGRQDPEYSNDLKMFFFVFLNHTFYKYFFFLSFLILSIVESTEVLINCTIVYKGGLALNSILLNKQHTYIHTLVIVVEDFRKWYFR